MTVLGGMFERLGATSPPQEPRPNPEIHTEILAAPTVPRHSHWRVVLDGKVLCSMIGEPMTEGEALEEVQHRWPAAGVMHADTTASPSNQKCLSTGNNS